MRQTNTSIRSRQLRAESGLAGGTAMTTMSPEIEAGIRPFHVEFTQADIEDLRSRIRATRWPERETVTDDTQGIPLATMEALASYWANEYDFGRVAAQLNLL